MAASIPDLNPAPFTGTSAMRINNAGQVAGNVTATDAHTYFIWDGSATRLVPGIAADSQVEMGLNARGEFVANSVDGPGSIRPFVYRKGSVAFLDSPSGEILSATSINDRGQVSLIGYASGTRTGIAQNGQIDWLATPPFATWMVAEAINNSGQLAGGYGLAASWGSHAFTTRNGEVIDLGLPGTYSVGMDINERGDVVGLSGSHEGALWEDGQLYLMADLVEGPAWDYLEARDINDAGQIAGTACRDQSCMAVVFNPVAAVPEAPHWAMLGLGLLPLPGWRRRIQASGADRRSTS